MTGFNPGLISGYDCHIQQRKQPRDIRSDSGSNRLRHSNLPVYVSSRFSTFISNYPPPTTTLLVPLTSIFKYPLECWMICPDMRDEIAGQIRPFKRQLNLIRVAVLRYPSLLTHSYTLSPIAPFV